MTFEELEKIISKNNIPKDVLLLSDSGWECDATDMNGVYYNEGKKTIVFTQSCSEYEQYDKRYEGFRKRKDGYIPLVDDDFEDCRQMQAEKEREK